MVNVAPSSINGIPDGCMSTPAARPPAKGKCPTARTGVMVTNSSA